MKSLTPIICLSTCVFASSSLAKSTSEDQAKLLQSVIPATVQHRKVPRFPQSMARQMREGWVQMSFVIDKDGNVKDPIIEDSSGQRGFERSALKAVEDWKYNPATENGKPIEQCRNKVMLTYNLDNYGNGVKKKFRRYYIEAYKAIEANELAEAEELLEKLGDKYITNLYEDAWYWMIKSIHAKALQQDKQEISYLWKALSAGDKYLGSANYQKLSQRKFSLHTKLGEYSEAMAIFEALQEDEANTELVGNLSPYAEQIENLINSDKVLPVKGSIQSGKKWSHKLIRHAFAFDYQQGQLDKVEIRCDNRREIYSITQDAQWQIPQSWGQCTLFVDGKEGTEFEVLELPNQA